MNKKKLKNVPTMANRSAIIIAAITFVLGFFSGAGFMFFKTDSAPSVSINSNTAVDQDRKSVV